MPKKITVNPEVLAAELGAVNTAIRNLEAQVLRGDHSHPTAGTAETALLVKYAEKRHLEAQLANAPKA